MGLSEGSSGNPVVSVSFAEKWLFWNPGGEVGPWCTCVCVCMCLWAGTAGPGGVWWGRGQDTTHPTLLMEVSMDVPPLPHGAEPAESQTQSPRSRAGGPMGHGGKAGSASGAVRAGQSVSCQGRASRATQLPASRWTVPRGLQRGEGRDALSQVGEALCAHPCLLHSSQGREMVTPFTAGTPRPGEEATSLWSHTESTPACHLSR